MDLNYFKHQICDELEGAKEYSKLVIESKITHPKWTEHFISMAHTELEHAKTLKTMFDEYYEEHKDSISESSYKQIVDYYAEQYGIIGYMLSSQ